ncbi:MAG: sugar ABC transporter ATP-binding protein [Spirochaetaceae bacterium]|nr:MAG: sugar ABC transporter ATP-binding protein [Spirochaetaceae bacterium]
MISIEHVSKSFPGVQALDDVSFTIDDGEVHGLVGENGAGKSTLIKILSGIYPDYQGSIRIDDQLSRFNSVHDAQYHGLATIFQELTVIQELSVAENIFLGREPVRFGGVLDWEAMRRRSSEVLEFLDAPLDPRTLVGRLSVANQQIVEICKALVLDSRIIIMDEPTSSLTEHEVRQLFSLIRRLKERGITILYVSHKIEEIFEICDSVTVFRDGKHIGTMEKDKTTADEVIRMMVGRSMSAMFPARTSSKGELLLSVRGLGRSGEFQDIDFDLYGGEILGFAGLIGAGRTEVARAVFGATRLEAGEITLYNRSSRPFRHPHQALSRGLAYLSEDRKGEGLMLQLTIRENMSLSILHKISRSLFIRSSKERELVDSFISKFKVKLTSMDQLVESLSGGNQQKIIISKLLLTEARVFIFDEPTRGIDVGAKYEIYKIMNDLTAEGKGIIFISSELPEVLGVADRIFCMREGRILKEFTRAQADPEAVMRVLLGGTAA